jgi:nicotinamidase-related amidase
MCGPSGRKLGDLIQLRDLSDLRAELSEELAANERRGLTRVIGFGAKPAVVVVDYTRAFTEPGDAMPLAADFAAEIAAAVQLLEAARAAGAPIYFTAPVYDEPDLADAGIWAIKVPASVTLRAGTPGAELDPRLGRGPGDALVIKKYASAFFGTDLASRLTARGVDTLLLCGCTTSGCVRASAVDGLQHGFRTIVVLEAVGDRNPAAHRQSLLDMQAKYADIATLDAARSYLQTL